MAIILPTDSGLDLTQSTPSGPQSRDPVTLAGMTYRQRLRFWRRSQDFGVNLASVADKGTLLIDFSKQSLTTGVGTAYTNALGSYTVTRTSYTHQAQLTGVFDSVTATGWEIGCTGNTTPSSPYALRYQLTFSTPIDLSTAANLVFELEYPQEMQANDFGGGLFNGIRTAFYSDATNGSWQQPAMWGVQSIAKHTKDTVYCPMGGGLWTAIGGTGCNWSSVTRVVIYAYHAYSNGGFRMTLRKVWANRVGKKALVAYTFDDSLTSTVTNAVPIFNTYAQKAGIAVISSAVGTGGAYATLAELQTAYAAGWSMYNHMVYSPQNLEVKLTPIATPWSANTFTVTCSNEAYADAVVGQFWTIRNSWGPEFSGSRELLAKNAGNQLVFSCPTQPAVNSAAYFPRIVADWPGQSRATRLANHVTPCTTYLNSNGLSRGSNVFIAPQGAYDVNWAADLRATGFRFVRTTDAYFIGQNSSPYYLASGQIIIPDCFDPMDTCTITLDNVADSGPNRALLAGYVDTAISTGQFIHFMGHDVKSAAAALTTQISLLDYLVGYVKGKIDAGQAQNVTLEQMAAAFP